MALVVYLNNLNKSKETRLHASCKFSIHLELCSAGQLTTLHPTILIANTTNSYAILIKLRAITV